MRPTPKTYALLVLFALLVGLGLISSLGSADLGGPPVVRALARDAVTRIELSGAEDKLVLKPQGGQWRMVAPYDAPADQQAVTALLTAFRKEIPVDVQVDSGNDDKYGLEPGKGIVVEAWTDGEEPTVSLTVGADAQGGTTFVRLSGSDAIYRARIGGRARFDHPPAAWRSRLILDLPPERVVGLQLQRESGAVSMSRTAGTPGTDAASATAPGPWTLDPAPPWTLDQRIANAVTARLAGLKAITMLPHQDGELGAPLATAQLVLDDESVHTVKIFAGDAGTLVATVDEAPERYRVAGSLLDGLPRQAEDMRDRTVLRFPAVDLDTVQLEDAQGTVLVRQDAGSRVWQVLQPDDLKLDVAKLIAALNAVSELRAAGDVLDPNAAAGALTRPTLKMTLTLIDGSVHTLEIGAATTDAAGRVAWFARGDGGGVTILSDAVVSLIKAGFNRS